MTPRLSFAARITLILILGIGTAWTIAFGLYYIARSSQGALRPTPAQIAAIADLVERTPADQRPLILTAVGSEILDARIAAAADDAAAPLLPPARLDAATIATYEAALDGRAVTITAPPARRPLGRLSRATRGELRFRIALRSGETLLVDATSPLITGPLGLPAGFGAGLLGSLVALGALYVMHRETRPLARLVAAVDRIDLSDKPVPLPAARRSAPEIQALIAAFDRLQGRLSELLKARMAMLGGISHDVRTFAARLRLRVERIPDALERDRAIADIGDMIHLLDDALLASRAGAGELAEELVEFDELVGMEVADRVARGAVIAFKTGPGLVATVLGDRVALRRVVANIIDNALAYGSTVSVTLATSGPRVALTVDDDGPGIPPDQKEAVLEPFVRLEPSRNRRTGGAGLGLAIVRSLVVAHHGDIRIADAPGGGARIVVSLKLFRP